MFNFRLLYTIDSTLKPTVGIVITDLPSFRLYRMARICNMYYLFCLRCRDQASTLAPRHYPTALRTDLKDTSPSQYKYNNSRLPQYFKHMIQEIRYDLVEVKRAAKRLNVANQFAYFHVTGTYGKGSMCAMLSELIAKHTALSVGRFTSPHLLSPNDCIWIKGSFLSLVEYSSLKGEAMASCRNIALSSFELLTLVAFMAFTKHAVKVAVVEVGMGGLNDATNILEGRLISAVIGPIDIDHQQWLGSTVDSIATHKCGIMRPFSYVVLCEQRYQQASDIILQTAASLNCVVIKPMHTTQWHRQHSYQTQNAAAAGAAFSLLSDNPIQFESIACSWPGRLSYYADDAVFGRTLVDGAHHAYSAKLLCDYLNGNFPCLSYRVIIAMTEGKNYIEFINTLSSYLRPRLTEVFCTESSRPADMPWIRAVPLFVLQETWLKFDIQAKCVDKLVSIRKDEASASHALLTVICGSLYLVSDFYKIRGKSD